MNVDTLIIGATIITMDDSRRVITDGAVGITGDRISAVGKREDLEAACVATETIDGRSFVMTPGFINGHVHLTETLLKGFIPEDLPFDEGLMRWTIPLYEIQSPAEQAIGARLAVLGMLKTGTTCFLEAGTLIALDAVFAAIEGTGIRGRVGAWTMDRSFAPDADESALTEAALRTLEEQMIRYPGDQGQLVSAWPMLIGHNTATDALWQGAKRIADDHGGGICAHMSPVANDANWYIANTGHRPIEHLAAMGVLGANVNLIHMVHTADAERTILVSTKTNVTFCPGAALRGGYGAACVGMFPEMATDGVNLLLGTDGADHADMMRAIGQMAGMFKDARQDTGIFPASRVIEMATINGARAMGLAHEIGSIATGMKADLVLHDVDRPEWRPLLNPVNQLVWSADGRGVHSVWVNGRRVVDSYVCTTIDEQALFIEAQSAAESIVARSGLPALSDWPVC